MTAVSCDAVKTIATHRWTPATRRTEDATLVGRLHVVAALHGAPNLVMQRDLRPGLAWSARGARVQ